MTRSLGRNLAHSLIISAVFISPSFAEESRGEGKIFRRSEAVKRPAAVDCFKIKAHQKPRRARPKVTNSLVKVGTPIKLNDQSAPEVVTAGVWSPSGDSIAFVAPTGEYVPLNEAEALKAEGDPANSPSVGIARSVNSIWLYSFPDAKWSMVAEDGARPRFSKDGKRLLYISSDGARAVDLFTMTDESLGSPEAGDPHKRFHTEVLSDGSVLSTGAENLLRQWGASKSVWARIELAPNDEVHISPDEEHIAVFYSVTENNPNSALVVYNKAGDSTTVLKNCPVSSIYATWSPDGSSLIYPMTAKGQPEVWESRLDGGAPSTRLRLQTPRSINELSLSPDNEYVTLSQIERSGRGASGSPTREGCSVSLMVFSPPCLRRETASSMPSCAPKGSSIGTLFR